MKYGILCDKTRIRHLKHHELRKDLCPSYIIRLGQMEDRMKELKVQQQVAVPHTMKCWSQCVCPVERCPLTPFNLLLEWGSWSSNCQTCQKVFTGLQLKPVFASNQNSLKPANLFDKHGRWAQLNRWMSRRMSFFGSIPCEKCCEMTWTGRDLTWALSRAERLWTSLTLFGYIHVSFHAWHSFRMAVVPSKQHHGTIWVIAEDEDRS